MKTQIYEEDTRRRKALMAKIERALSRVGIGPNDADFAQPADAAKRRFCAGLFAYDLIAAELFAVSAARRFVEAETNRSPI